MSCVLALMASSRFKARVKAAFSPAISLPICCDLAGAGIDRLMEAQKSALQNDS